ncbi:hypothetical protein Nepgr_008530 [Nepenthes gracilis]|uniref:Uncharacterized protein n=1 Tax=Nepenthes gracilis TaxID=150966 RepID=A0AAD3XJG7_NEPGR|nr:hypothetical protein Nepgr_008530 [Nepenthes gracilis]
MMLETALHALEAGMVRSRGGYVKLSSRCDDEKVAGLRRRRWTKKMRRSLRGVKLWRCRKVNWRTFSIVMLPRRIGRVYADMMKFLEMEGVWPNLIFSTNWGLPVLSHSSVNCRICPIL